MPKTLDELIAENTDLSGKVTSLTADLTASKSKGTALETEKSELQAKLTAETSKAADLQTKLDATNKELGELKSKDMDVERRAAEKVKSAGIAGAENSKEKQASGAEQPKGWKDDAKAHFEAKSKASAK